MFRQMVNPKTLICAGMRMRADRYYTPEGLKDLQDNMNDEGQTASIKASCVRGELHVVDGVRRYICAKNLGWMFVAVDIADNLYPS